MPYKDSLLALPGIYYAWAQNILEKSPIRMNDQSTGYDDMYQDLVLSVDFGLSSYGYLKQYTKI